MLKKLSSRKFWVTIGTGLIVLISDQLGINPDTVKWLVGMASTYVLGQGAVDAVEKLNLPKGNPPYSTQ